MSDLDKLIARCNEMDITEQINCLGDAIMPMNAAAELARLREALTAAQKRIIELEAKLRGEDANRHVIHGPDAETCQHPECIYERTVKS
jgi:hypothetical protein